MSESCACITHWMCCGLIDVQVKRQDFTADKAHDCSRWLDWPHACPQVIPATTAAQTQVSCVTWPTIFFLLLKHLCQLCSNMWQCWCVSAFGYICTCHPLFVWPPLVFRRLCYCIGWTVWKDCRRSSHVVMPDRYYSVVLLQEQIPSICNFAHDFPLWEYISETKTSF